MKKILLAVLVASLLPTISFGQEEDIDVEFGFDDFTNPTTIETEFDLFTNDGKGITDGEFTTLFPAFPNLQTDNPGFITPATEGSGETGRFNPGDALSLVFSDGADHPSGALGFVTFYNPITGALETGSSAITIENQGGETTTLDGTSISGESSLLISIASDGTLFSNAADPDENLTLGEGQIHNHLTFDLDDSTATEGAFGLLLQFEADVDDDGLADFDSDKFFLVFNNGLSDAEFGTALAAFSATGVPEPSACIVISALASGILTRRRRRS